MLFTIRYIVQHGANGVFKHRFENLVTAINVKTINKLNERSIQLCIED